MPGLGEAHGITVNEFGPMLNGDWIGGGIYFVVEPLDGGAQGAAIELGEDGRGCGDEWALVLRLFVAYPAEFPPNTGHATEGVQDVRRSEAGGAGAANPPAAIEQDAPFAAETGEEISPAEIGADHLVRQRGFGDSDMANLMPTECGAILGADDPLLGAGTDHVCFR